MHPQVCLKPQWSLVTHSFSLEHQGPHRAGHTASTLTQATLSDRGQLLPYRGVPLPVQCIQFTGNTKGRWRNPGRGRSRLSLFHCPMTWEARRDKKGQEGLGGIRMARRNQRTRGSGGQEDQERLQEGQEARRIRRDQEARGTRRDQEARRDWVEGSGRLAGGSGGNQEGQRTPRRPGDQRAGGLRWGQEGIREGAREDLRPLCWRRWLKRLPRA